MTTLDELLPECELTPEQEARAAAMRHESSWLGTNAARLIIHLQDENEVLRRWHKEAVDEYAKSVAVLKNDDLARVLLKLVHVMLHTSYTTVHGDGVCPDRWAEHELKKIEDQLKALVPSNSTPGHPE